MYFCGNRFSWVDVEITNHCNFNCWFCPRNAMTRQKGLMDYEKFKKMVLNLDSGWGLKEILIGGIGEPTLHPDLIKMLSFVKQNTSLRTVLITNGSKLGDRTFVEGLFDTAIDKVIVSLRFSGSIEDKSSLPPNFNYDRYIKSILDFIELKYKNKFSAEITIAFLKKTLYSKYILNIDTKKFINEEQLNGFIQRISKIINVELPSYGDYTKKIKSHLSNVDNIQIHDGFNFRFDGPSCWTTTEKKYNKTGRCYEANYGSCLGLLEHFAILWNGDVSTCCADFDAKNQLGNVFEENDIVKILSSHKSMLFAKMLRAKKMPSKTCKICRGGHTLKEKWANIIGTMLYTK